MCKVAPVILHGVESPDPYSPEALPRFLAKRCAFFRVPGASPHSDWRGSAAGVNLPPASTHTEFLSCMSSYHVLHDARCLKAEWLQRHPTGTQSQLPFCGRAPLVLAPHTTVCMGAESFTGENRSPLHVWTCISIVDVNV